MSRLFQASRHVAVLLVVCLLASPARAQTDYLNTDRGRPLLVQDAVAIERHAVEFTLLPLLASTPARCATTWQAAPAVAWGLAARTQIGVAAEFDRSPSSTWRSRSVELEALHALNIESTEVPAIALSASVHAPVSGETAEWSAGTAVTRTFITATRLHLNAAATGRGSSNGWIGGVSVDHPLPFQYLLLAAEVVRERPTDAPDTRMAFGVGVRWQAGVHWAIDAGVRRLVDGPDRGWQVVFGQSYVRGFRALIPRGSR